MKNRFLSKFNNVVVLNIKTRNTNAFLKSLYKLKIDIHNVNIINYKELIIQINEYDIDKVKKLSILNKIEIIDYKGNIKRKKVFLLNKTLFLSLLIGLILLTILTNIIFSIEINHSSNKLRNLVMKELNKNGIHRLQFRKSFNSLEKIKENILKENKDKIEWLEINRVGTKYIVKVEERKISSDNTDYKFQDIVALKDGVIKKINVFNGVKNVDVNQYVKKGDVLISGNIYLNENLKNQVKAAGEVYAEVWYKISVEYNVISNEKIETGNKYNTYSLNFFDYSYHFSKNKFKYSNIIRENILYNNIIPISISKDVIYELYDMSGLYTEAQCILSAKNYAKEKMMELLSDDEYIISDKVLKYSLNSNTIYMDVFYKVYQNISYAKEIDGIKGSE